MNIRIVLFSRDTAAALIAAAVLYWALPEQISNAFAKDLYGVGISVLSIVFSVFFAALAMIISSGDDDFIRFLDEHNLYSELLDFFRWTLLSLFSALLLSAFLYTLTLIWTEARFTTQSKGWMALFAFFFAYSLFATFGSSVDAVKYAHRRCLHLRPAPPENQIHEES